MMLSSWSGFRNTYRGIVETPDHSFEQYMELIISSIACGGDKSIRFPMSFQFGSVIEDLLLRLQKSDLYPVSADESSEWLSDRERRLVESMLRTFLNHTVDAEMFLSLIREESGSRREARYEGQTCWKSKSCCDCDGLNFRLVKRVEHDMCDRHNKCPQQVLRTTAALLLPTPLGQVERWYQLSP